MASSIFQSTYGYQIRGQDDHFFQGLQEAIEHFCSAQMYTSEANPSIKSSTTNLAHVCIDFWVNIFPALSNLPDWLPGTGWKRVARDWREQKEQAMGNIFQWTKDQVVS
jgi:hypothetical protein